MVLPPPRNHRHRHILEDQLADLERRATLPGHRRQAAGRQLEAGAAHHRPVDVAVEQDEPPTGQLGLDPVDAQLHGAPVLAHGDHVLELDPAAPDAEGGRADGDLGVERGADPVARAILDASAQEEAAERDEPEVGAAERAEQDAEPAPAPHHASLYTTRA